MICKKCGNAGSICKACELTAERDIMREQTARKCVEICNSIWDDVDEDSDAGGAVDDCIAAIRTEFAITGVLLGGGK